MDLLPSAPGNEEEVKAFSLALPLSALVAINTKAPFFANHLFHCKWLVLNWLQHMQWLQPRWTHLVKIRNGWPAVAVLHYWLWLLESQWEQSQGPHLQDLPIVANWSFWIIFNHPLMIEHSFHNHLAQKYHSNETRYFDGGSVRHCQYATANNHSDHATINTSASTTSCSGAGIGYISTWTRSCRKGRKSHGLVEWTHGN